MASPVDICNLALGQLGAERITGIENPQTPNEQLCALYFPIVRDTLLEEFDWSFIMKRAVLTVKDDPSPEWGFGSSFTPPPDTYRIINVRRDAFDGQASTFKWRLEEGKIICDADRLFVRYIAKDVPTTSYSGMFVMAFSKMMASEMCIQITENRSLYNDLKRDAANMVMDAINSDNMQGTSEQIHARTLQNARRGGGVFLDGGGAV